MADPVVTTLRRKRAEIENAIAAYEKRADEARRDLAAIDAAIRIKKPAAGVNRGGLKFQRTVDAGSVGKAYLYVRLNGAEKTRSLYRRRRLGPVFSRELW